MSRLLAVAANTYRESVRERVLYNLVFFAIVMTLSGLLMGRLSIRQDDKIIKDIGLAATEVFGTLIAVFVGVTLVSKEIERRSLYPLLAKPLARHEFVLGKFAGLCLTLLVNTGAVRVIANHIEGNRARLAGAGIERITPSLWIAAATTRKVPLIV